MVLGGVCQNPEVVSIDGSGDIDFLGCRMVPLGAQCSAFGAVCCINDAVASSIDSSVTGITAERSARYCLNRCLNLLLPKMDGSTAAHIGIKLMIAKGGGMVKNGPPQSTDDARDRKIAALPRTFGRSMSATVCCVSGRSTRPLRPGGPMVRCSTVMGAAPSVMASK